MIDTGHLASMHRHHLAIVNADAHAAVIGTAVSIRWHWHNLSRRPSLLGEPPEVAVAETVSHDSREAELLAQGRDSKPPGAFNPGGFVKAITPGGIHIRGITERLCAGVHSN